MSAETRQLRMFVHDYAGHPFQVQLSRELASRGHDVLHAYAGYNQTPRGEMLKQPDDPASFNVKGVYINESLEKDHFIKRWRQERGYGRLIAAEVPGFEPDVVISANAPLDAQRSLLLQCKKQDVKFVFWLQDFIGIATESILRRRIPIVGGLIGGYYQRLERQMLLESDAVVAITEDFRPTLSQWGIAREATRVIPNWAPIDELPVGDKHNRWSKDMGVAEAFTFLYTGTLRMKHNPALLLALARAVGASGARVVVTSEGPGAEWLRQEAADHGLDNLVILDFQPMERYGQVLASADVLVAILEKEAGAFSVPSKVLSYLCAQRPLLLAVPKENLAARIVQENEAGLVVSPEDVDGFVEAARELMADPSQRDAMGRNARRYAEQNFDIRQIADRFEKLIQSIL